MCRWIAYIGTPITLEKYLFAQKYSLIEQSLHARKAKAAVNGDGFGIGWYSGRDKPGIFRDILPAWSDDNLHNLAHHIESSLFMAHVRAATGTAISRNNCHPFSYQQSLFMHNGQIGGYCEVRRSLESLLSDELYKSRAGTTDSELLFLLLLQQGLRENFVDACRQTINLVNQHVQAAGVSEAFRLTAAISDGKSLSAIRYSSDIHAPTLFYRRQRQGMLLVSEPLDENLTSWDELPAQHILQVDAQLQTQITPL